MSKRAYHPERGDIVAINFVSAAGREIDKRRPAIVLSPGAYNLKVGLCVVVPTSSDMTPGRLWVPVPPGVLPKPSMVLCDYLKSFDWRERSVEFIAKAPAGLMDEITTRVLELVDPVFK